jgi:hypothetical protein
MLLSLYTVLLCTIFLALKRYYTKLITMLLRFCFITLSVLLAALLTSCHKKCSTVCSESDLSVYARGFSETDLDTVLIREYADDGTFSKLRNSETRINQYHNMNQENFGTLLGWFNKHSDWVITFPSTQRSYRISAITDQGKTSEEHDCRVKDTYCQNEIATFKIDGVERIRVPAYLDK